MMQKFLPRLQNYAEVFSEEYIHQSNYDDGDDDDDIHQYNQWMAFELKGKWQWFEHILIESHQSRISDPHKI